MMSELPAATVDWGGSATSEAPSELPRNWPNRRSSRTVTTAGMRWHYQRMGSGVPFLLLHGTAASTHSWRDLMPLLASRFDVLAVDLPGHGYTDRRPDGDMSLPALADAIRAMLLKLDFDPQFAVGHSAGAAIALRMQLDKSIRARAIIGLNAALFPFGGSMTRLFAPMAKVFAGAPLMARMIARRAKDPASVSRILLGTGSQIDRQGIKIYQQLLQRESHVSAVLAMMASWRLDGFLNELRGVSCGLHLLSGENDRAVSPDEANTVAQALPHVQVISLESCGHLAHEEQPGRVAECLRRIADHEGGENAA